MCGPIIVQPNWYLIGCTRTKPAIVIIITYNVMH